MTTLNVAFESKLALEDEGYESGNENFNLPTPLRRSNKIHNISSIENSSFQPDPVTPCSTDARDTHFRPIYRYLTFSYSEEDDDDTPADEFLSPDWIPPVCTTKMLFNEHHPPKHVHHIRQRRKRYGRGFPNCTLKDEQWNLKEIPDRPMCIHEHSLAHGLCPYPCPFANYQTSYYDTLDLSDISEFEDIMTTSSDEDIPPLKEIGY